jgi:DNA repair exonuclease SbcCD nuclease subunit
MKYLLTGDIHIGARKESQLFYDIILKFFQEIKNICISENIDVLWILGDLFDDRQHLHIYGKQKAYNILDILLSVPNLQIKIIAGNHDIFYKNSLQISSLNMFIDYNERIEIIKTVSEYKIGNKSVIAFPWLCPESDELKRFNEIAEGIKIYDLCLGHFEVNTFDVIEGVTCDFGLKIDSFKNYKKVFSGHFHNGQRKENVQYCGSPYELTWGECGDKKGVYIFDSSDDSVKFIENTWSPKHIKLKLSELTKDKELIKNIHNNWIKLFIDTPIDDNKRLDLLTLIESQKPLEYSTIDEVEGVELDNENIELSEFEGNELSIMCEYVDQQPDLKVSKDELKLYANSLYEECLKETEE